MMVEVYYGDGLSDRKNTFGEYFNPYIDEYDPNYIPEGLNTGVDQDDFSEGDIKALTEGIKQEVGATQGNSMDAANITINAGSVSMNGNLESSNNGEIKTIEQGSTGENAEENKVENDEIGLDGDVSLLEPKSSFFERFKDLGGLEKIGTLGNELYQGIGGITDSLYVDGGAPTQERAAISGIIGQNIKDSTDKREKDMTRAKDNWANNKSNISIMADKYMADMSERYKGKPEAYIRMKAEEKAKSALKDMSAYVQYGVTDVNLAYELYQDANAYGYTPEQAVRSRAGYEKFNSNSGNIAQINLSGGFTRNDYTSVQAAIPDARTYYNAGYTDINEMAWVDKIARSLGRSPEFAMRVDQTLKKKGGKINYSGKNEEMKKLIQDINSTYGG